MNFWGQVISIIAMCGIILSFQCKRNRNLVIVLGAGALLFAVSYFMLGQSSAATFNILTVLCSVVCLKEGWKNIFSFLVIAALYIVATFFTYDNWWSLMLLAAQIAGSYSLIMGSGTFIRNTRFFIVSPIWLINNTVVCFTIGGTICEIITMTSIIISFIRFRKTGFEK